LDLAPGARLAGVIDDKGALGARPQVVGLMDAAGQFGGHRPPVDVLAAQEIAEHADLAARIWHNSQQKQWSDLTFINGQTKRAQRTFGRGSPSARRLRLMAALSKPASE